MFDIQTNINGFYLRSKKGKGKATLFRRIRLSNGKDVWINSTISIDISTFTSRRKYNLWSKSEEGIKFSNQLQSVNNIIIDKVKKGINDTSIITDAIDTFLHREEREKQEEEQKRIEEEQEKDVIHFYNRFFAGISGGTILHKGRPYSISSIRIWKTFGGLLKDFRRLHYFNFDTINIETSDKFISYLRKRGFMEKTVNKNVICFRKLCNYAATIGLNTNGASLKAWSETTIKEDEKRKEIYLPSDVIQSLFDMKLTGIREIVRDIFFVGCVSCLRFSDFSRLNASCFKHTDKGNLIIDLTQRKTGEGVVIPVLNDNLTKVMEKYNYNLPVVTEQVLNKNIKEICKDLSRSVPSLSKEEITVLTFNENRKEHSYQMTHNGEPLFMRDSNGNAIKYRWELVSSHTARRSGITNLYLTGKLNTYEMMSISGHQSLKVFKDYIKLSKYEQADIIVKKMNL
jgi:hypothetical protein